MPLTTMQVLFSFDGRIGRQTWWLWTVVTWLASSAVGLVFLFALFIPFADVDNGEELAGSAAGVALLGILVLAGLAITGTWVSLALGAKRLHDQDKSGWLQLILLAGVIPVVGWVASVVLFVMCGFIPGTPGRNRHGPGPDMASGSYGYLGGDQYNPYNPYVPGGPQQPTRGAWVNPPLPPPGAMPQQPSHPPNVPFQEGGEWRSYNNAGQLLRWDAAANRWVPIQP